MSWSRRGLLKRLGQASLALPFHELLLHPREARAAVGGARRVIFFYFPDGVPGPSQEGQPSRWHCTGTETSFTLPDLLQPLAPWKQRCVFFNGLSMGPTDAGSHPGGAKKLLTAVDGAGGESVDQYLAKTAGASAPFRHLYLGAMANHNNASGDKHISYPSAGQSVTPLDDPRQAFGLLFGPGGGTSGGGSQPDTSQGSVIDGVLEDMAALRAQLGGTEASKLDLHLESLREVERRIKSMPPPTTTVCPPPAPGTDSSRLYEPARFPEVLRAQVDLMVQAMACGKTRVGVLQASHHTSELIMSRFPDTPMYDAGFDMRSHQASHYGSRHDLAKREFSDYVKQRRWFVEQFAYLLDQLHQRPDGDGATLLDTSVVLLCTEVCDGNQHLHDNMPFILAGNAGGAISTGRLLQFGYERHSNLLVSIARAMGQDISSWGQASSGPLRGLLR